MYFEELINHLFNIKVLSHINKYHLSIAEYKKSISETAKLETELHLKDSSDFDYKAKRNIIDKSGEASFFTFEDKTKKEIIGLLNKGGVQDSIFGSIEISLDNLLNTLNGANFKELKAYIFGRELFNQNTPDLKSNRAILELYSELYKYSEGIVFTEYHELLEGFKIDLNTALKHNIQEVRNTIINKDQNAKKAFLKPLKESLEIQINKSPFLVVDEVANYDYSNILYLAKFLWSFSKSNNLSIESIISKKDEVINFFKHTFFKNYLEKNFESLLQPITLNDNEIFAIIQNKNKLINVLMPSYIETFDGIEKTLIKENYFDNSGCWQPDKKVLVEFIIHCNAMNYFKFNLGSTENAKLTIIRRFFEHRYNASISNQFKPSQRNLIEIPSYTFNWISEAK